MEDTNVQTRASRVPGTKGRDFPLAPYAWKPNSLLPTWPSPLLSRTRASQSKELRPAVNEDPVLGQTHHLLAGLANLLLSVDCADSKGWVPSHFPAAPWEPRRPGRASIHWLPSTPENRLWPHISSQEGAQHLYLLPALEPVKTPPNFSNRVNSLCLSSSKAFVPLDHQKNIQNSCSQVLGP